MAFPYLDQAPLYNAISIYFSVASGQAKCNRIEYVFNGYDTAAATAKKD